MASLNFVDFPKCLLVAARVAASRYPRHIYNQRVLLMALTWRSLQRRYAGTWGGVVWCVLQPAATVAIYWLVFAVGFRAQGPAGDPYILFFVTGLAPWLFFNDGLRESVESVTGNPHLVKKVVFPTELLPLAQILSTALVHGVVLVLVFFTLACYQVPFSLSILGTIYYFLALSILVCGLGWLVGSLQVFFRDVGQIVAVVLGFWFWLTPVVWPPSLLAPEFGIWMLLNPLAYVIGGYRDCLLYGVWPLAEPMESLIFWGEALGLLAVGGTTFQRLKPEFAEAL